MNKIVEGKVINNPEVIDEKAVYELSVDGNVFDAESSGKQAVKDFLFIRCGQCVEIEGETSKNRIKVRKAKIDISKFEKST